MRKLAIETNLQENDLDFLLYGYDSIFGDYQNLSEELTQLLYDEYGETFDKDEFEIQFFEATRVVASINKFIELHPDYDYYSNEINEYLDYCISKCIKVCCYFYF